MITIADLKRYVQVMQNTLHQFMYALFMPSTMKYNRVSRRVRVFDLVSLVEAPTAADAYIIYEVYADWVSVIKCDAYSNQGTVFNASQDDQLIYKRSQFCELFYKISDISPVPRTVVMRSSPIEANTLALRLEDTFVARTPLCGMFVDKNDGHLMLVVKCVGGTEGHSVVFDMSMAPFAGITHFHQVAHAIKTKYILDKCPLRAISPAEVLTIIKLPWRKEVIDNLLTLLFNSIGETVEIATKCELYCRGTAKITTDTVPTVKIKQKKEN